MNGTTHVGWLVCIAGLACHVGAACAGTATEIASCAPKSGGIHTVVRVIDSETLKLDDASEVRLIGALAPKPETLRVTAAEWAPSRDAQRALESAVVGRTVELRYDTLRRDRYGRTLAQVLVRTAEGVQWVQQSMVRAGHARAYTLPGQAACLRDLLLTEAAARRERLGLWNAPIFGIHDAADADALLGMKGRFVLVEGQVSAVTNTARETFVNFGPDWRRDFTASMSRALVDKAAGARERLNSLVGRPVRVRGWIEQRNGPMIHLGSLDEIEELDGSTATSR